MGTDSDRRDQHDPRTLRKVRSALKKEQDIARKEEIRNAPELINPPKKPFNKKGFN